MGGIMRISLATFRSGRFLKFAALPAALLAGGVAIGNASYSAYSSQTTSPTNNWATGTVHLDNDSPATALFTATNLKPTSTGTRCVTVSSTGSLPSTVKLYGTDTSTSNALAASINLVVTQGSGATNAACAGFTPTVGATSYTGTLAAFGTANTNFANGFGDWAPAGTTTSETRTYQFTYTVAAGAANSTQGGTAAIGFTWEAQNS
jgi:hypothetical protein